MGLCIALFVYWLVVVGECTYLGRYAVRFIYQRGAAIYDRVRQSIHATDEALLLPVLAHPLVGRLNHTTLDIATGTGRVPLLLASQPWFDGVAHGLDFSPAMLAHGQAKVDQVGLGAAVEFTHGEAGSLPWPDGRFDLVTCLEALEYFPHPRRALAEMVRVLRPGGTLVVSKYPDVWARWLPGKALSTSTMTTVLQHLGLHNIDVRVWQPGQYELVVAEKVSTNTAG
jgi:ubiquinone/menaquinone biosynthesis C-methylase UbiE